jgi:hypothetical protein
LPHSQTHCQRRQTLYKPDIHSILCEVEARRLRIWSGDWQWHSHHISRGSGSKDRWVWGGELAWTAAISPDNTSSQRARRSVRRGTRLDPCHIPLQHQLSECHIVKQLIQLPQRINSMPAKVMKFNSWRKSQNRFVQLSNITSNRWKGLQKVSWPWPRKRSYWSICKCTDMLVIDSPWMEWPKTQVVHLRPHFQCTKIYWVHLHTVISRGL